MDDADDLARRYLALWTEYLTALVADPQAAELLQRWIAFTGQFAKGAGERAGNPFAPWPPVPADARDPAADGAPTDRSNAVAAPASSASGERGDAVGELAQRVGELERRLAALERAAPSRRSSRGDRTSGKRPGRNSA